MKEGEMNDGRLLTNLPSNFTAHSPIRVMR